MRTSNVVAQAFSPVLDYVRRSGTGGDACAIGNCELLAC